MTQPASDRNPVEAFFDAFSGQHLFRAVNHAAEEGKQFYGELWQYEPELHELNASGWSIYFCANDPGGLSTKTDAFTDLRCIYQDAEPGKTKDPAHEPDICGQLAHFTVETSPGRFQRFWLTEPIPAHNWRFIQRGMVEWYGHDSECATGPAQIMRAPGFLNTKKAYADNPPRARITADRSHLPRLTLAAVAKHFAFPDEFSRAGGNVVAAFDRIQSSGGAGNVVELDKTRAARQGVTNTAVQQERQQAQLRGVPAHSMAVETILEVMALLNPSMGRNEWRRVAGALHYMSQGEDWGFDIFETWSGLGDNYTGGMDCEGLWRGLKLDAKTLTHWITLRKMSAQVKPGKLERARLHSKAFDGLRERLGDYVEMTALEINFPERKRGPDGFTMELDKNSKANAEALLRDLGISARWDDFASVVRLNDEPLSSGHIVDLHATAHDQGWKPTRIQINEFVEGVARQSPYNPAQEHFNSLRGRWDGKPRLATMFIRHLGAPDTPSIRECAELVMYAAVRRVYDPGCKFDLMPILQGAQGLGKSSLFRLLCPFDEWFLNSVRLDLEEKRLYAQIQGKLFIEFGELSGKKNAEIEKIKAFVTQQTDEYIQNHATAITRRKRSAVFVGTTNEHRFLRDLTGNRRFPVVPVTKELNFKALISEREQLWAEAVTLEDIAGDLRFSADAEADMRLIQGDRIDRNVTIEDLFEQLNAFALGYVHRDTLWEALGYDNAHGRDKKLHATAHYAMADFEKMMRQAGWTMQTLTKHDHGTGRGHFRKAHRVAPKEIIYTGSQFAYKSAVEAEAGELLD